MNNTTRNKLRHELRHEKEVNKTGLFSDSRNKSEDEIRSDVRQFLDNCKRYGVARSGFRRRRF